MRRLFRLALQGFAVALGVCTIAYMVYVGVAWYRFGHVRPRPGVDVLADRFMPSYEIREEHWVPINASASDTMQSAREISLDDSPVIRAIFKGREVLLRSAHENAREPRAFLTLAKSIGWRVLAEARGREIVLGAVTQPWKPNVVFRGLPPAEFAAFDEPGYVKILWTMRADPTSASTSIFRTETRAVSTDSESREKFRGYWAKFSPGIVLIRIATLPLVKAAAERRAGARNAR